MGQEPTFIYPKEDEAVEIHADIVIVDGRRLFTDRGYLDEIIIKSLGAEGKTKLGRARVMIIVEK